MRGSGLEFRCHLQNLGRHRTGAEAMIDIGSFMDVFLSDIIGVCFIFCPRFTLSFFWIPEFRSEFIYAVSGCIFKLYLSVLIRPFTSLQGLNMLGFQ